MNFRFPFVRIPLYVKVQTTQAAEALDRKREKRIRELAGSGWKPSTGWLTNDVPALLGRQAE